MKYGKFTLIAGLGTTLLALSGIVDAASVTCGPDDGRSMTVSPALVGGVCYYQDGNLQNQDYDDIGVTGLVEIEKDEAPAGNTTGFMTYTMGGQGFGTWTIDSSLWTSYSRLFLGAHFGGGQGYPDSFVLELDPAAANTGTYAMNPGLDMAVNGLSNLYLFGVRGTQQVPEPAALALLGLGLAGLGVTRRRRHS